MEAPSRSPLETYENKLRRSSVLKEDISKKRKRGHFYLTLTGLASSAEGAGRIWNDK
jgi:hypothetical protein